jgi:hypothetical protein
MFRKLVLGFAATAALGVGLLSTAQPASAQSLSGSSWSVTIGSGHGGFVPAGYYDRGWGPQFGGHGGHYGRGWGGHNGRGWGGHGHWRAQHCFVRPVRVWDGWGWSVRPQRVCR